MIDATQPPTRVALHDITIDQRVHEVEVQEIERSLPYGEIAEYFGGDVDQVVFRQIAQHEVQMRRRNRVF